MRETDSNITFIVQFIFFGFFVMVAKSLHFRISRQSISRSQSDRGCRSDPRIDGWELKERLI
ncbi:unnamed protein product [Penicillium roqueforti FM164]|uniref:Genomic scaffold, ProqFM164S03 n=1 Tax=Penicillium roqueforti (strain FM164) TaxID=1365484 RepID=W6QKI9_PENRF|nr:unnamed protein product [Penicillium roqueforti FM164]